MRGIGMCAAAAAILFNGHITWAMLGMSQFVGERTIWRRTSSSRQSGVRKHAKCILWGGGWQHEQHAGFLLSAIAFLIDRRGRGSNYFKSNFNLSRGRTIEELRYCCCVCCCRSRHFTLGDSLMTWQAVCENINELNYGKCWLIIN